MIEKKNTPTGTSWDSGTQPADAAQKVKQDAGAALETAKSELGHLRSEAEAQAASIAEEAKAEVGRLADKAKGMASEHKEVLAGEVDNVAHAVEKVASELEANQSATAGYVRTVSDTVTRFSETLRTNDVDQLLRMAEDFGRKQPAAFAGVMAIAGFAASRFVRASANRRPRAGANDGAYSSAAGGYDSAARTEVSGSTMGGNI